MSNVAEDTTVVADGVDTAAKWAANGVLYNTGQDCCAGSRLYVQDTVYDKFLSLLVARAKELVIGDGFDAKSGGGPVVCQSLSHMDRPSLHCPPRCRKHSMIVSGIISSLERRKVPESLLVVKNAQPQDFMWTQQVHPVHLDGSILLSHCLIFKYLSLR